MNSEPSWIQTMMDPSAYPHHVDKVELVQTHISWVFLAGESAYKIKKPVNFGFLDFTTLEKRRHFCSEELRLNRRLCPSIYRDVWPINRDGTRFSLGGSGDTVEWTLVMKRMPEAGMMAALISRDAIGQAEIDAVVGRLVPFYRSAASGPEVARYGEIDIVRRNTEENFEQMEPFLGRLLDETECRRIAAFTRGFLDGNGPLFLSRKANGWIREGHGDLYSANICFDRPRDAVYVFDCIEFNERFRCGDVASDVAFLAMDLDYHGLPDLAQHCAESFAREIGDAEMPEIMAFYKCYRACVRSKIACFTWGAERMDDQTRQAAWTQARDYCRLAARYADPSSCCPALYVFFGLSGTGKSTVASAWAQRHGLPVYNSDRVRKEVVAGIPALERHREPFGQGLYSPEQTARTYGEMARLAGRHLTRGESVVLDATYGDAGQRARLLRFARSTGAVVHFVLCTCPESEIRRRLSLRQAVGEDVSDGRWEIYLHQRRLFADTAGLAGEGLLLLPTDRPVEVLLEELDRRLSAPPKAAWEDKFAG